MKIHLSAFAALSLVLSSAFADLPRTWTSKDGSATMEATFHKVDGDNVVLLLPNGRTQTVQKQFLSDEDVQWIEENSGASGAGGVSADAAVPAALKGNLIDDRGNKFDLAKEGPLPKYYLFYYSASWCGPCKAFTPELVRFHRKWKARKANFEVVLVPSDRSREDEIAYLKDHRMPWPGVDFDKKNAPGIPNSNWGFIPAMALFDADGNRLLQVNDEMSKEEFLDKAEDIFTKDKQTAAN